MAHVDTRVQERRARGRSRWEDYELPEGQAGKAALDSIKGIEKSAKRLAGSLAREGREVKITLTIHHTHLEEPE